MISGHLCGLGLFKKHSQLLQKVKSQAAHSVGLWHASHLYSKNDISQTLEPFFDALETMPTPCRTILSTATGKPMHVSTAQALFAHAIDDMLRVSIRWHMLEEVLSSFLNGNTAGTGPSLNFEFSNTNKSILTKSDSEQRLRFQNLADWCSSSDIERRGQHKSANVAIVGMSCRFPSVDNTEELCRARPSFAVQSTIWRYRLKICGKQASNAFPWTCHTPFILCRSIPF